MIEPIASLGSNHKSLRTWAAYSARGAGELQSEVKPVAPPSTSASVGTLASVSRVVKLETVATLETVAALETPHQVATLESVGSQVMTCRCSLCSNVGLSTIASPLGGKVIPVNLTGALSEEESAMIEDLRQRDAEVRRHEQSHTMAAGAHALGSAKYTYQVGPDGKRYAVGGEVQVDMSEVPDDPEATLRKAQQLQAAALAPSDPSGADRSVAMAAARMAAEARSEIMEKQSEARTVKRGSAPKDEKSKETTKKAQSGASAVPVDSAAASVPAHSAVPAEAAIGLAGTSSSEGKISSAPSNLDMYA